MRLTCKSLIAVLSLSLAGCARRYHRQRRHRPKRGPQERPTCCFAGERHTAWPRHSVLRRQRSRRKYGAGRNLVRKRHCWWQRSIRYDQCWGLVRRAPEFPPSAAITINATETADSSKTAASAITLDNPIPQVAAVVPVSIPVGRLAHSQRCAFRSRRCHSIRNVHASYQPSVVDNVVRRGNSDHLTSGNYSGDRTKPQPRPYFFRRSHR